jgi:hypothetical protein
LEKATEKKAVVRVDKTQMTGNKILETLPARPRSSYKRQFYRALKMTGGCVAST